MEDDQLDAVIGLASNLFYSTAIPACLLIFRANKSEDRRGRVLFIDGSSRFTKGRNQNQITDDDIEALVSAYQGDDAPHAAAGVQARLVDHAEIEQNGWDLNLVRYLRANTTNALGVDEALDALRIARVALREAEKRLEDRLKASGYA